MNNIKKWNFAANTCIDLQHKMDKEVWTMFSSMIISNVWFNKQRSQVIIHINLICVTTITVRETILYQHERFAMLSISISFPVPKSINSLETFNNAYRYFFNTVYFPTQQNSSLFSASKCRLNGFTVTVYMLTCS